MLGVSESRKPIKGGFAKRIIEEVARIRDSRLKKSYISNSEFDNEVNILLSDMINMKFNNTTMGSNIIMDDTEG